MTAATDFAAPLSNAHARAYLRHLLSVASDVLRQRIPVGAMTLAHRVTLPALRELMESRLDEADRRACFEPTEPEREPSVEREFSRAPWGAR